jgi:6-pyruvoyl-tetrahydropterin synthase
MYTINKSFNIAYGHSVHAQTLNKELALDDLCKCQWWHGHNGDVNVYVESETLDAKGMVLDFKELNFFKNSME